MKNILVFILLFLFLHSYAQEDKTVTLVVSGQGKTQEEAKQNALRGAIEQAFGTFISSKTEMLNDNLIKDEIVSVSNGNINKYEIISELQLPDNSWSSSLSAVVSINKLISYTESKGFEAELKGALFAINIKKDELNKQNEIKAVRNMCDVAKQIADNSFEWTIKVSDPLKYNPTQRQRNVDINDLWIVPINIGIKTNKNFKLIPELISKTLTNLNYSVRNEIKEIPREYPYPKLSLEDGREVFPLTVAFSEEQISYFIMRSDSSVIQVLELINYFNRSLLNFKINNGSSIQKFDEITLKVLGDSRKNDFVYGKNIYSVYEDGDVKIQIEDNFRVLLAHWTLDRGTNGQIFTQSLFYKHPDLDNSFTLPYYSYDYWVTLKKMRGKEYNKRCIGINDYVITKDKLEYETEFHNYPNFNFLNNKKFNKSIPFSVYGPVISFVSITNKSEELINIFCSQVLTLSELGKIQSYQIEKYNR
jgi:hypothetical protein